MWQRFTQRARRTVFYAQEEADRFGQTEVTTGHLLVGILLGEGTVAVRLLQGLNVNLVALSDGVRRRLKTGIGARTAGKQLSSGAKSAIDRAYEEARALDNTYIGTEHLLLGLLRQERGSALEALAEAGVDLGQVRMYVAALQDSSSPEAAVHAAFTSFTNGPKQERLTAESNENTAIGSQLEAQLEALRRRINLLGTPPVASNEEIASNFSAPSPIFGDLGIAFPSQGRKHIEVAHDAPAFRRLIAVFLARDAHGYRTLTDGDQTVFLLPSGTPLKLLVPPPDTEDAFEEGYFVRVLKGDYEGYAGWLFKSAFERTGFDDSAFPPV